MLMRLGRRQDSDLSMLATFRGILAKIPSVTPVARPLWRESVTKLGFLAWKARNVSFVGQSLTSEMKLEKR
jgi:hypothetical protein